MRQLILCSESPRRHDLLTQAGYSFDKFPVKVSENLRKNLNIDEQILDVAQRKAQAAHDAYKPLKSHQYLLLTADTMVVFDSQALGKPEDHDEAIQTLSRLSGQRHEVKTAVCLVEGPVPAQPAQNPFFCFIETSEVWFHKLSQKQIADYVATGDHLDKAGSYGLQTAGQYFVDRIVGDPTNVVGLPMVRLKQILKERWNILPK